jgi:Zn-finger nucleic acid-binding protein
MQNNQRPMACPVDGTLLVVTDRSGIEIDRCPTCRGIWLHRVDLDKILARQAPTPPRIGGSQPHAYGEPREERRSSLLEELFD